MLIAEYSTERELLTSLQNNTVDKVWLFDCQAKEIDPDLDFMIVSVLDDELFTWQKPALGVGVQLLKRSNFGQNFTKCLANVHNRELKMTSGSQSELQLASQSGEMLSEMKTGDVGDYDDDDIVVDYAYPLFWKPDVRKHCLILFTALLFFCKF